MAGKLNLKENMTLASGAALDNIFSTEESRQEAKLQKVYDIPISEIRDFKDHPFKVRDDQAMLQLIDSVQKIGVLVPALLRPHPDGGYEMVSGHRRKRALSLSNIDTIPSIIRELSDEDATIIMVDSNIQRDDVLPSEKAFAYKMKMDAMRRKAGRPGKENSRQVGENLSVEKISAESGDSARQVHRYIRLAELVPALLDRVDDKSFAFNAAVEVSYITQSIQQQLLKAMEQQECAPTLAQARRLRNAAEKGTLDIHGIELVLSEEKPIESKVVLSGERFDRLIPKDYDTPRQKENYIFEALSFYQRHRDAQRQKQEKEHSR